MGNSLAIKNAHKNTRIEYGVINNSNDCPTKLKEDMKYKLSKTSKNYHMQRKKKNIGNNNKLC